MADLLTEASLGSLGEIRTWFESPLGSQVLKTERAVLDQLLPRYFGYHLLQLSVQSEVLFEESPIQNKIPLGLDRTDQVPMVARATELPFQDDSIDVILLHHLLEFLDSPLETLREIARVSLPMGHLVITGFNPVSLWGLWKLPASITRNVPWNGRFIRPGRLMDWLNVLNFKIDRAEYCFYRPPITGRRERHQPDYSQGLSRRLNLPVGGVYTIVASKHKGSMTPMRPVWKTRQAFGGLTVVRPTGRSIVHNRRADPPIIDGTPDQ